MMYLGFPLVRKTTVMGALRDERPGQLVQMT